MMTLTPRRPLLALGAALLVLSGCAQMDMSKKQTYGTLGGGAAGAILGSNIGKGDGRIAATAIGTLLGAWAGSEIGSSLDRADQAAATQAMDQAYVAPVGQTVRWNNPQSGNSGTVTTTRDGYSTSGSYCREYQQSITVGGKQQKAYGTACQAPDGSWQIVQ